MFYETNKCTYNTQQFETTRFFRDFRDSICSGKVALSETDEKQGNLVNKILEFNSRTRPHSEEDEK